MCIRDRVYMYVRLESGDFSKLQGKNILLFGAGSLGLRSIEECNKIDAKILGFIDNNRSRRGEMVGEYKIYAPEDIKNFHNAFVLITSTYVEEIKKQLAEMEIERVEVIRLGALRDVIPKEDFFKPLLNGRESNCYLYKMLQQDAPFFAGRIGSNELECMVEYYYMLDREKKYSKKFGSYHDNLKLVMKQGAGFFPVKDDYLDKFVHLYTENLKEIDFIWSMWLSKFEDMLYERFAPEKEIGLYNDTAIPYGLEEPWTKALEGRKVLVIHPFEESIRKNYKIREKLFENTDILPEFELITLKAVQSIADEEVEFIDWFAALEFMEEKIDKINFDIALIGAGAYGFPLGAYIKKIGKKAIHVGGMLQMLFGIRGKYYDKFGYHNEYWTRPLEEEKPKGFQKVEAGRYW